MDSLADFARANGISPNTARQWKRRGKIAEIDGKYAFVTPVTPKTAQKCDSVTPETVTERDVVTPETVTDWPKRDELPTDERDSECSGCAELRDDLAALTSQPCDGCASLADQFATLAEQFGGLVADVEALAARLDALFPARTVSQPHTQRPAASLVAGEFDQRPVEWNF